MQPRSQYVTSTASSVSTKAQEGMDSVKKKLEKLVTDTRTAVDTQTSKLGFVETDAEALNTKAAGLHAKVGRESSVKMKWKIKCS